MAKRISLADADCPVARALDVIGDWWSLLIIRDAFDGVRRFSDFQSGLGIAKGMLSTRLRDLVERGVLTTEPASDGSAYRDYVLTERGRSLFLVLVALRQWGEGHLYREGERHSLLVDTAKSEPVARLELRSRDGRVLRWTDTRVRKVDEKSELPGRKAVGRTKVKDLTRNARD
ncbi:helix-turn-helix domain-containing protein [Mesorhizobium sp. BAC0120]|uniref:winged helix-turn-helix transcriptional regulator n=1 Tax=Mesorhizobium sp. BAC0120 TaxID=3090670 RepID=UPI00298BEA4E|nr:helix-turn-helix domain-containing protein [Mesorhizobium sp. BAC0120]MDW6023444.1 helix-turn-helix domain-containing protein [Mesorhizobium sp. BAC0120]